MKRASRGWDVALVLVTIAIIAPLFSVHLLPFTDLSEHVAVMASLAHYDDAPWRIAEHYEIAWTKSQYLLFHLTGGLLTKIVGDAILASKLLLAGAAVGWVASARAFFRALDLDERLAILAALLFWNRPFVVGFHPYIASIPVVLATLAFFVRTLEHPTRGRQLLLVLLAIVTFYSHVSALTLLAAVCPVMAFMHARGEPTMRARLVVSLRSVAWLVPVLVLAVNWVFAARMAPGAGAANDAVARMEATRAVRVAGLWIHDIWAGHVDDWIGVAFWGGYAALLVSGFRVKGTARTRLALVPLIVALALYMLTPFRVGGGVLLNVRLAPVVAVFALAGVRSNVRSRVTSGVFAALTAAVVVQAADNVAEMRKLARDVDGLEAIFASMPKGAHVMTLNFEGFDPHAAHFPPYMHVGSYSRAYGASVAQFSFSHMDHWSLQYRREAAPPAEDEISWGSTPCFFRNSREGDWYDFVLVRGDADPFRAHPAGPEWRVARRAARYTLYEKVPGQRWSGSASDDLGPCAPPPAPPPP